MRFSKKLALSVIAACTFSLFCTIASLVNELQLLATHNPAALSGQELDKKLVSIAISTTISLVCMVTNIWGLAFKVPFASSEQQEEKKRTENMQN